uniref:DUF4116 domain-containing protein n=1 Tax=viral metagenome TaxID=1070528 RepID=A0A6C0EAB2_9ZZZZ
MNALPKYVKYAIPGFVGSAVYGMYEKHVEDVIKYMPINIKESWVVNDKRVERAILERGLFECLPEHRQKDWQVRVQAVKANNENIKKIRENVKKESEQIHNDMLILRGIRLDKYLGTKQIVKFNGYDSENFDADDIDMFIDYFKGDMYKLMEANYLHYNHEAKIMHKKTLMKIYKRNPEAIKILHLEDDFDALKLIASQNGLLIKYMTSLYKLTKEQRDEIIITAIKQNPHSIQYIRQYCTNELYLMAVEKDGLALQHVPADKQTLNIVMTAIKQNAFAIQYVNKITSMILEQALKNNPDCISTLKKRIDYGGLYWFTKYDNIVIDRNIINNIIKKNGLLIEYIDNPTYNLMIDAVKQNPNALLKINRKYIEKLYTHEIHQLYRIHLETGGKLKALLEQMSDRTIDDDLLHHAIDNDPLCLADIPAQTEELINRAVKLNPYAAKYAKIKTKHVEEALKKIGCHTDEC